MQEYTPPAPVSYDPNDPPAAQSDLKSPHDKFFSETEFRKALQNFAVSCISVHLLQSSPETIDGYLKLGAEQNPNDPFDGVYRLLVQILKDRGENTPTTHPELLIFRLGELLAMEGIFEGVISVDRLKEVLCSFPSDTFDGSYTHLVVGQTLFHILALYHHYALLEIIIQKLVSLTSLSTPEEMLYWALSRTNRANQTVVSLMDLTHSSLKEDQVNLIKSLNIPASAKIPNTLQETPACQFYRLPYFVRLSSVDYRYDQEQIHYGPTVSRLHTAATKQNVNELTRFLQEGMNPNVSTRSDYRFHTLYHLDNENPALAEPGVVYICQTQRRYYVRDLTGKVQTGLIPDEIDLSGLVNKLSDTKFTDQILVISSENGHTLAPGKGSNPSENKNTPLNLWVEEGHVQPKEAVLTTLLKYGASLETPGCGKLTPLQFAVETCGRSSQFYVPLLLKHGAILGIDQLPKLLNFERESKMHFKLPLKQLDMSRSTQLHNPELASIFRNHVKDIIARKQAPGSDNVVLDLHEILQAHSLYYGKPGRADAVDRYPSHFDPSHSHVTPATNPNTALTSTLKTRPDDSEVKAKSPSIVADKPGPVALPPSSAPTKVKYVKRPVTAAPSRVVFNDPADSSAASFLAADSPSASVRASIPALFNPSNVITPSDASGAGGRNPSVDTVNPSPSVGSSSHILLSAPRTKPVKVPLKVPTAKHMKVPAKASPPAKPSDTNPLNLFIFK